MFKKRLDLHAKLCDILGSKNVYFQPPESIRLVYPCIVYSRSNVRTRYANNKVYNDFDLYDITVIDKDPDSTIYKDILKSFQMCSFNRFFTSDNLNHNVLSLYY